MNLEQAKILSDQFQGTITKSTVAQKEFGTDVPVLIPTSNRDLQRALKLARAADRQVFVRSGNRATPLARDVDPTSLIISMEAFKGTKLVGGHIHAGAATTVGELAKAVKDSDLFLPVGDDPTRSLISVLLDPSSPFPRSAPNSTLRDALVRAQVTPVEGVGAARSPNLEADDVIDFLDGGRTGVLSRLEFDGSALKEEAARWLELKLIAYNEDEFASLCDELFSNATIPKEVDLSVRVTTGTYGLMLVVVRATGRNRKDLKSTVAIMDSALKVSEVLHEESVMGPGLSLAGWVESGPGKAADGQLQNRFGPSESRPFGSVRNELLPAIDFVVGVDPEGQVRTPSLDAWVEIVLLPTGNVTVSACLVDKGASAETFAQAQEYLTSAIPGLTVAKRSQASSALQERDVLPHLDPVGNFTLETMTRQDEIPFFRGRVEKSSSSRGYRKLNGDDKQYARSSYSAGIRNARMKPAYIVLPTDVMDVIAAVRFALDKGLSVVARSGGHQYCGLSSGGNRTLLIDMKGLEGTDEAEFSANGSQMTVKPGAILKDFSKELVSNNAVIPHGECPKVGLGGHIQTGGVGHQLRTLGLAIDHVDSFQMVVCKADGSVQERTFTRPSGRQRGSLGAPVTDDDIFRAVLGGGPGSWGVLTEVTFNLVIDDPELDCKTFYGVYSYEKPAFEIAMKHLQTWALKEHSGELPQGADLFLTVISGDWGSLRPSTLVVETMSTNTDGHLLTQKIVDDVDDERFPLIRRPRGKSSLSKVAHHGVRSVGIFGMPDGREFDLPYKKSLYLTRVPFNDQFLNDFVDLVDEVEDADGLKVVFQAVVGGGKFLANKDLNRTYMQRRDALVQIVFDVFYKSGRETEAQQYITRMKTLLGNYSNGEDLRMFWGTFEDDGQNGAQLDMSRSEVQNLYYDRDEFKRLQEIKTHIDPHDLFRTTFTVPRSTS